MVDSAQTRTISEILEAYPEIKLAYLFGSQATGDTGPLSDYDIAVYLGETLDKYQRFDLRLTLTGKLSRALGTDHVDVVVLNDLEQPALAYNIINDGHLLVEQESYRLLVEPKILNEHFDFQTLLQRHNLTAA